MEKLQQTFPNEYKETSSHKLRQANDIQFGFTYNNFLLEEAASSKKLKVIQKIENRGYTKLKANVTQAVKELEFNLNNEARFICI